MIKRIGDWIYAHTEEIFVIALIFLSLWFALTMISFAVMMVTLLG